MTAGAQTRLQLLHFAGRALAHLRSFSVAALISFTAGQSGARDFVVHDWDLDEGLPSTCINSFIRTKDGYVWLATQHGLVRFDGNRFVTFRTESAPALKDNRVSSLAADPGKGFWVGTVNGSVARFDDGRITSVDLGNATQGKRINSMTADAAANLWVATAGAGLIWRKADKVVTITTTNGLPSLDVWQVLTDRQGRLWYVTSPGKVGWLEGDQCHDLEVVDPLPDSIRVLAPARDGGFWLAAFNEPNMGTRILKLKDGLVREETQSYPWQQKSERGRPGALLEDDGGNLWCGTSGEGVFLRPPSGQWRPMVTDLPMLHAEVLCLMQDEGESVWVGTRTSGLHQSVPRPLLALRLPAACSANVLLTVCVRHDGSVWGGTDGAGVFRWTDSQVAGFGEAQGLSGMEVCALFEDSRSNLWAGTSAGLYQFRNARFEAAGSAASRGRITALYEDRRGGVWAGTARGLVGIEGATDGMFDQPDGLPAGQIVSLTQDHLGRFWVAVVGRGVYRQEGRRFVRWTSVTRGGPPSWRWDNPTTARTLLADADGSIWVGSYGYGLFRLDGDRNRCWTWQLDGLPSNHLLALLPDDDGNFWFSSENGIFGYSRKALLDYRGSPNPPPIPFRLTRAEGLPYKVCSGAGSPAGTRSPDGRLWFPDGPALVGFDPATAPRNVQTWPPVIEDVRVDGVPLTITPGGPIRIMSGARSFEFHFTSPNVLAPNRVRFRYQLEGLDEDWSPEGTQRSVRYSRLLPGDYRFRVMTRNSDEVWNEREAAVELAILPRLWETKWFQAVAGLALLGGIVLGVWQMERIRSRRKLALVEHERTLERERARIARDIHDDLGASLTQLALLGDMAKDTAGSPDELHAQTSQISEAAREMAQSLEAIVWAVRSENDTLRSLVEYMSRRTDELFEKMPRQYQFVAPADLPEIPVHAEVRHNVFLSYKEALTNALKHAGASNVRIELAFDKGACRIAVLDNGKGFEPGGVRAAGTGLKNMRQRLEEIGGRFELETQPGQGTTVRLYFPLDRHSQR